MEHPVSMLPRSGMEPAHQGSVPEAQRSNPGGTVLVQETSCSCPP